MSAYVCISPLDNLHRSSYKLHALERKCCSSVEKLKTVLRDYLQNGIQASDLLERTLSFLTVKKVLLHHNGYSRCCRDVLRIFPTSGEDVEPLCCQQ